MLTIIIGVIGFVVIGAGVSNGEWGVVALAAVVLLFLMCASSEERKDVKAWRNCRDYWYEGGPERKRERGR